MSIKKPRPFTYQFLDEGPSLLLELTNATQQTLKRVEILTIFLKNEETSAAGPAQVHIRFDSVERILPAEKSVFSHTTLINGKVTNDDRQQLARLQGVEGSPNPYTLDISWQDAEGRTRFQRIPVGH
ncbi:MAG TPA: hypothetical protein VK557_06390 [Pyrinomonadaceae bacterium]|nr:hypothetical protein [Pyrinomonadaceae bacterium]